MFKCKSCGKRFPEHHKIQRGLDYKDLLKSYLYGKVKLDYYSEKRIDGFNGSKSTARRRILNEAKKIPGSEELLRWKKWRKKWERKKITVMAIDTTYLNAEGKENVYLEVYDVTTHDQIAYLVRNNKKAVTIVWALIRLKEAGYHPDVVVTDLARELLTSIKRVFPHAIIQGCTFHLDRRLNTKILPTKNHKERMAGFEKSAHKLKMDYYESYKQLIMSIAESKNQAIREQDMKKLLALNSDNSLIEGLRLHLIVFVQV